MKKTITESQLRQIVKESVKKVLKEYGGISLSDYDNPSIRYNRLDGDEMAQLSQYDAEHDGMNGKNLPEYNEREEVYHRLLKIRNQGLITDDEFERMRDVIGA